MRFLVTGTAGFIGLNLADYLESSGAEWIGVDRRIPGVERVARRTRKFDLRSEVETLALVREVTPDVIINLAARTDLAGKTVQDYEDNTLPLINLVTAQQSLPRRPFLVHASSRLVFSPENDPLGQWSYTPDTSYGESKVASEWILRALTPQDWTIARPTSIWGPHFGVPYHGFFDAIRKGVYVSVRSVPVRKTMGYVGNTVQQLLALADEKHRDQVRGQAFFLGDEESVDLGQWAGMIADEQKIRRPRRVPMSFLKSAALVGTLAENLGVRRVPLTRFRLRNIYDSVEYDTMPIHSIAGRDDFSLAEGVSNTVEWLNQLGSES